MLQQTKMNKNRIVKSKVGHNNFFPKNRKGLSAVMGYVLLISFAMVIGGVVYYWMASYLPGEEIECPDGVSVFIEDFECEDFQFNLTIKNNGKFNVDGYFIRGATKENQEVATEDLSEYGGGSGGFVRFGVGEALRPGKSDSKIFELENYPFEFLAGEKGIYSIEIIPIRYEVVENKERLASCSKAKIKENINCLFYS